MLLSTHIMETIQTRYLCLTPCDSIWKQWCCYHSSLLTSDSARLREHDIILQAEQVLTTHTNHAWANSQYMKNVNNDSKKDKTTMINMCPWRLKYILPATLPPTFPDTDHTIQEAFITFITGETSTFVDKGLFNTTMKYI